MTDTQASGAPLAQPPAEQDALNSGRVLGLVKRILANGWMVPQPAWTAITSFSNGYTANTAVAYRLVQPTNEIVFRGALTLGAASLNAVAFTLPTGARPTQVPGYYPCAFDDATAGSGWTGGLVYVDTSYNVSIYAKAGPAGSIASLTGLRFPVV